MESVRGGVSPYKWNLSGEGEATLSVSPLLSFLSYASDMSVLNVDLSYWVAKSQEENEIKIKFCFIEYLK